MALHFTKDCDRCGKEIAMNDKNDSEQGSGKVVFSQFDELGQQYTSFNHCGDLCVECTRAYADWWDEPKGKRC